MTPQRIRIPALFERAQIDSYPGIEVTVRLNPSEATWTDFRAGGFSASPQEQALRAALEEMITHPVEDAQPPEVYAARLEELDQAIAERRVRMGCALFAFFGSSTPQTVDVEQVDGSFEAVPLDFSSPEQALATAEDTRLPVDIAIWLTALPIAARDLRAETIRKETRSLLGKQS